MTRLGLALALTALAGTGASAQGAGERPALRTPQDVSAAVRSCWRVPDGLRAFERMDVTVRFSIRSDGALQGVRRITYASLPSDDGRTRELLAHSALDAVERCAPFKLEPGLGEAVAGRMFAVRISYRGPKGRGV